MFRRKDVNAVTRYLAYLQENGITCLRLMLEYAQTEHRYFEQPVGQFEPRMVQLWDDLFALCRQHQLRILLTPFDTFWLWRRWRYHPYNHLNGGPCRSRTRLLTCPATLAAMQNRLAFVTERWGGSGVLFGWDLWNEIHPEQAGKTTAYFTAFVAELSLFLRNLEIKLHGRAHPQTVSVFDPVMQQNPALPDIIFQHPALDFATSHFYDAKSIDRPQNTWQPAIKTGQLVQQALNHIQDNRPFLDSEHGPIKSYKKRTLPAFFDEQYFRLMQWAHLAAGGAGGGMRWPYRRPHQLTPGMVAAQRSLALFVSLIDWPTFNRRYIGDGLRVAAKNVWVTGCSNGTQAVVWLMRKGDKKTGLVDPAETPVVTTVRVPGLRPGCYKITHWHTEKGLITRETNAAQRPGQPFVDIAVAFDTDLALAIVPEPVVSSNAHQDKIQ